MSVVKIGMKRASSTGWICEGCAYDAYRPRVRKPMEVWRILRGIS